MKPVRWLTLGLSKLTAFWDDNGISIDGEVEGWFTDDTPARFEAYGWQVIRGVDGHDAAEIKTAIETARKDTQRPTLICCKTTIGCGAPNKQGGHNVHGSPLGGDEIAAARAHLQWPHAPFEIPADIYAARNARDKGAAVENDWNKTFDAYRAAFPELAAEFTRRMSGELPCCTGRSARCRTGQDQRRRANRGHAQGQSDRTGSTVVRRCRNLSAVRPT
nr:hypothetical protein [Paludibacterium denitrificans]